MARIAHPDDFLPDWYVYYRILHGEDAARALINAPPKYPYPRSPYERAEKRKEFTHAGER